MLKSAKAEIWRQKNSRRSLVLSRITEKFLYSNGKNLFQDNKLTSLKLNNMIHNDIRIEGFWNTVPEFSKLTFETGNMMTVFLTDGRRITVPLSKFPSIEKLSETQRKNWYLFGNGFSFDDCDEVFHIEQILGNYNLYKHETDSKSNSKHEPELV